MNIIYWRIPLVIVAREPVGLCPAYAQPQARAASVGGPLGRRKPCRPLGHGSPNLKLDNANVSTAEGGFYAADLSLAAARQILPPPGAATG